VWRKNKAERKAGQIATSSSHRYLTGKQHAAHRLPDGKLMLLQLAGPRPNRTATITTSIPTANAAPVPPDVENLAHSFL
jgi:hypothetical protein